MRHRRAPPPAAPPSGHHSRTAPSAEAEAKPDTFRRDARVGRPARAADAEPPVATSPGPPSPGFRSAMLLSLRPCPVTGR